MTFIIIHLAVIVVENIFYGKKYTSIFFLHQDL